jgi:hypothetical protein
MACPSASFGSKWAAKKTCFSKKRIFVIWGQPLIFWASPSPDIAWRDVFGFILYFSILSSSP